jgi:hypothetical protein
LLAVAVSTRTPLLPLRDGKAGGEVGMKLVLELLFRRKRVYFGDGVGLIALF